MDLGRPYSSVSPTLEGDVLAVLARTSGPLTGRAVARLAARGSQSGINRALDDLVSQGIVGRADAGSSDHYLLNRDHVAAPAVEHIAGLRSLLWERLRQAIADWEPPVVHASVFGSAARGEGGIESDIDVLVVHGEDVDPEAAGWRDQVATLGDQIRRWTGNHAGMVELASADLPVLARERPALAEALRADAVTLVGPDVATLLEQA